MQKRRFVEEVRVMEDSCLRLSGGQDASEGGAPPIIRANVRIALIDKDGKVAEERSGHNIFLNYGREWLAELTSLNTGGTPFRTDRIRFMAFGIGGTTQRISVSSIHALYLGWADYTTPVQVDTDPTVTGLEYPIEVTGGDYYDDISQPATFPQPGIVRYTAVVGYNEISYPGGPTSVPLSEIGLFTESVTDQSVRPVAAPPERFMVAYNTFDILSKTPSYVLQVDWELRYS